VCGVGYSAIYCPSKLHTHLSSHDKDLAQMIHLKLNCSGACIHPSHKKTVRYIILGMMRPAVLGLIIFIYTFVPFVFYRYRVTETILRTLVAVPDA